MESLLVRYSAITRRASSARDSSTIMSVSRNPSGGSRMGKGSEPAEPGEAIPALSNSPRITTASVELPA